MNPLAIESICVALGDQVSKPSRSIGCFPIPLVESLSPYSKYPLPLGRAAPLLLKGISQKA